MKTKTIAYLENGGVNVIETEVPDPRPGEVQIRGTACGICAWDLYTFRNGSSAPYAAPPGHEGIGYVVKRGDGVKNVDVGARVVGGGFAGFSNIRAENLSVIPQSSLADEHWIVEPAACVVNGVDRCHLLAGQRLVLIGCGFMGLMLVQVLARSPLDELVAIDIDEGRLRLAKQFGATRTINTTAHNHKALIPELAAGDVDTVVDTSGTQMAIDMATGIVKQGGAIVLFGWLHGPGSFSGDAWHSRGYTIINASPASSTRNLFRPAIRLIEKGIIDLRPLVTHVVSLDEYPALMERVVQKKEAGYIKGVVKT